MTPPLRNAQSLPPTPTGVQAAPLSNVYVDPSLIPLSAIDIANNTSAAYRYTVAYLFIIVITYAITRTKVGYKIVYYSLILMIVLVLLTQYKAISSILQDVVSANAPKPGGKG